MELPEFERKRARLMNNDMTPLVSVIVPVYNVEKYLECCLDSIVGQTYQNLEIILVNDGSTDRSGEICRQYAQNDSRIRLFTQVNQGQSVARNAGLDNMGGEYVVFVDSDDYISRRFVEILMDGLKKYGVLISQCGCCIMSDDGNGIDVDRLPGNGGIFFKRMSRNDVFDTMGTAMGSFFGSPCGKIFDRRIFKELRYPAGKIFEDAALFHSIYAQIDKVCYIDLKLYAYRQNVNSTTRKYGEIYLSMDYVEALLRRLSFFQQYGVDRYVNATGKEILRAYTCFSNYPDTKELKRRMGALEEEMFQVTGKRFFSLKYTLFKSAPRVYQFARKCYKKARRMLRA